MASAPITPAPTMCMPGYWQRLLDPAVKTVLVTGCGGGFDFVHSMTLIPQLIAAGKDVVVVSYSFGDPASIRGGRLVWEAALASTPKTIIGAAAIPPPKAFLVDATCDPPRSYGPEVGLCAYLDEHFPRAEGAPRWSVYATNARQFTPSSLRAFLTRVCNEHSVDAVVAIDGGSDGLMAGDEAGLGDPIEDAVTVASVSLLTHTPPEGVSADTSGLSTSCLQLEDPFSTPAAWAAEGNSAALCLRSPLRAKVLIAIGVGCDRFNGVSDAATLRAVSELTAARVDGESGFLGSMALEPTSPLVRHYSALIESLQAKYLFKSVIANSLVAAAEGGYFGDEVIPPALRRRVTGPGQLFLWPFMAFHFAFRPEAIFARALLGPRLIECRDVPEMYAALEALRKELAAAGKLRGEESTP